MIRQLVVAGALVASSCAVAEPSQCFGRPGKGRVDNAVKLPLAGANFTAYSKIAAAAGRTWVHSATAQVVLSAYAASARSMPDVHYVYGETGLKEGGRFRPHRTHQNGLSVDFFVPVRDAAGKSVPLPTNVTQRFGYDIEFDAAGRYQQYRIDFPALAEHLYQLDIAARTAGAPIAQVILDPAFMAPLLSTPRGPHIKRHINFMKGKPWVRHDEHFHVDFSAICRPL